MTFLPIGVFERYMLKYLQMVHLCLELENLLLITLSYLFTEGHEPQGLYHRAAVVKLAG